MLEEEEEEEEEEENNNLTTRPVHKYNIHLGPCPLDTAPRHLAVGWDFNVSSMRHSVTSGHTLQLLTSGILESRQRGTTRTHFDFTETVARTQQTKH